jgi:hypothetical protein
VAGSGEVNGDGGVPVWWRPPEPYQLGNDAALVHGAYSPGRVDPVAARFREALFGLADCPEYLHEPKFSWSVQAWSRHEAIVSLLWQHLDALGIEEAAAEVTTAAEEASAASGGVTRRSQQRRTQPTLDALARWETKLRASRAELGLSPTAYAALAKDVGIVRRQQDDAIERLAAEGREIRLRREAQMRAGEQG